MIGVTLVRPCDGIVDYTAPFTAGSGSLMYVR
jgi:hypothetical protein